MDNNNIPTVEPVVAEPVVATTPAPAVVAPVTTPVAPVLPDDTKDRTAREFEKLIQNNQRMAAQIAKLEAVQNAPTPTVNATPAQVNPDDFTYVDPTTGEKFVDGDKLKTKLDDVNAKAQRAEQIINNYIKTEQEKEIARQEKEAFAQYPELNPNGDKYDPNFEKLVGSVLQDSLWNPEGYGGKALSFKAAGDFVRGQTTPTVAQPAQADVAPATTPEVVQAARDQVTAQPAVQPGQQVRASADEEAELNNLIYRTRYLNDDKALAERIKHTEHILTKDANQT